MQTSGWTILERSRAALKLAEDLGSLPKPVHIVPVTSAGVGFLSRQYAGQFHEADNFVEQGLAQPCYPVLVNRQLQHITLEVATPKLAAMVPAEAAEASILYSRVILLFLLYDVADGLQREEDDTEPLHCAMSALYAFSLYTFHRPRSRSLREVTFDWSHASWWSTMGALMEDAKHSPRRDKVLKMLEEQKQKQILSSTCLSKWADWQASLPGYRDAKGASPKVAGQRLEKFLNALVRMIRYGTGTVALGLLVCKLRDDARSVDPGLRVDAARFVEEILFPSEFMVIELIDLFPHDELTASHRLLEFCQSLGEPENLSSPEPHEARLTFSSHRVQDYNAFYKNFAGPKPPPVVTRYTVNVELRRCPAWLRGKHTKEEAVIVEQLVLFPLLVSLKDVVLAAEFNAISDVDRRFRGEQRLYCALSALYILSLLDTVPRHDKAQAKEEITDPHAWDEYIAGPIRDSGSADDKLHYKAVKDMFGSDRWSKLLGGWTSTWAEWFTTRSGHSDGDLDEKQTEASLKSFMHEVRLMIDPHDALMSRELGRALPAGLAVFHPNSARRRTFVQRW
ncbi:hypothetical protein JCM3770_007404 [Rhodotorula araucariae]